MREKERTRALPLSNNAKRRRTKKVDPEKNLKALCKNALLETKRTGSEYYCPIKLDGVNGLNYEALRDYMMGKKVVKVINRDVAETALKKMPNSAQLTDANVVNGKVNAFVMQASSNYETIRSAVSYIYRRAGVEVPKDMARDFKKYIAGQKRTSLKEKQDLGLEIQEGKKALSFEGYEIIAKNVF